MKQEKMLCTKTKITCAVEERRGHKAMSFHFSLLPFRILLIPFTLFIELGYITHRMRPPGTLAGSPPFLSPQGTIVLMAQHTLSRAEPF